MKLNCDGRMGRFCVHSRICFPRARVYIWGGNTHRGERTVRTKGKIHTKPRTPLRAQIARQPHTENQPTPLSKWSSYFNFIQSKNRWKLLRNLYEIQLGHRSLKLNRNRRWNCLWKSLRKCLESLVSKFRIFIFTKVSNCSELKTGANRHGTEIRTWFVLVSWWNWQSLWKCIELTPRSKTLILKESPVFYYSSSSNCSTVQTVEIGPEWRNYTENDAKLFGGNVETCSESALKLLW